MGETEPKRATNNQSIPIAYVCVALAIVTFAGYYGVWNNDFLDFDDREYVQANEYVRQGITAEGVAWAFQTSLLGNWHPLTWITHMAVAGEFTADRAAPHIFANLLLHVANVILLYLVLLSATGRNARSFVVAALFALHPLHVESVAWIAERKDVLSGLFWILVMGAYVLYARSPGIGRYSVVGLGLALGLMAKPMLVTLPFALLLLDVWPLKRLRGTGGDASLVRLFLEKVPLIAIAAAMSFVAVLTQRTAGVAMTSEIFPLAARFANAIVSYAVYLRQTVWPSDLALFYPYPARPNLAATAMAAVLLIAISVVAIRFVKSRPYLFVGWFWFVGTLVPVIGLVQIGEQARADRYTYLPHIGLFVALVWIASETIGGLEHGERILQALSAVVLIACGAVTMAQQQHFKNTRTVFEHALAVTTGNYVAHQFVGLELLKRGQMDEAVRHWEEAVRANPHYGPSRVALGTSHAIKGRHSEAIPHFEAALEREPGAVIAHKALATSLRAVGDSKTAVNHWRLALDYEPGEADASLKLAWILATDPDESIRDGALAVELAEPVVRSGLTSLRQLEILAAAYAEAGRFEDALRTNDEAIRGARSLGRSAAARTFERRRRLYEEELGLRISPVDETELPR